jgi:pteridine reductase
MMNKPKVAIVTGAARRIGAAIVRALHADGMNIIIHYRKSELEAVTLMKELNMLRANSALALAADLSAIDELRQFVQACRSHWQQIDLLVNNASEFFQTPLKELQTSDWDCLLNTNAKAPLFLAQAFAPDLINTSGAIVNIIDVHGKRPMKDYAAYCISKAALSMVTLALAKELAPEIRVNGVSPGVSALPEGMNVLSDEAKAKILQRIPLKRIGSHNDVAQAVVFLARANYITGQILNVDGGRTLTI